MNCRLRDLRKIAALAAAVSAGMASAMLAAQPAIAMPLRGWVGTWKSDDRVIRIEKSGRALKISGNEGAPNEIDGWQGDFYGVASPRHGVIAWQDVVLYAPCQVKMRLAGGHLIVWSNQSCGGPHANFTGTYDRSYSGEH